MKYTIIAGSHRAESQSSKVAQYIEKRVKSLPELNGPNPLSTNTIDLRLNPLPLWDETNWQEDGEQKKIWAPLSQQLAESQALVVITPEWSGMVPPALKNLFLLAGNNELAHKPALIVSISSGIGGTYPVAELRMSSYKNTRICYIPDHLVIRKVTTVLNDEQFNEQNREDFYIKKRIDYSLIVLHQYAQALVQVRESGVFNYSDYPFGM